MEVLWQRFLSRLLGGSTIATTAVLMAYMGGLALGAALAGRRGDDLAPAAALRGYIRLELAVWLAASVTTLLLAALPVGIGGILAALPEGGARFLARFVVAALLLLVPTTAMGATLPLAVRAVVGSDRTRLLGGTGRLYAANTFGAVLGALLAPFLLLPAFGLRTSALLAASGSVIAALVARAAAPAEDTEGAAGGETPEATVEGESPIAIRWVALLAFSTGAAGLGFEVLWTRWLATLAGASVYAFAVVLSLVLLGIAFGSLAVSASSRRIQDPGRLAGLLAVLAAVLALFLLPLIDRIPGRYQQLHEQHRLTFGSSLLVLIGVGAVVILPPMLCFGAVLPLAVRAARSARRLAAGAVGRIYVVNTLGALAGAGFTGLLLVPRFGLAHTLLIVGALPMIGGLAVLVGQPGLSRGRRLAYAAVGLGGAAALFAARAPSPYAGAARIISPREGPDVIGSVLYYGEGPEGSVLVEAARANRTFYVSSRAEASDIWTDVRTQYVLGHLPALVAGGAKRSLVIALGSGMTAGALTVHGDVTLAELNRAVPNAARQFRDLNHDVVERARLIIEDGRVVLSQAGSSYDVVTTDPIHPAVAGSSSLYTVEHVRLCKSRLAENGAISLWVPLYQMGPEEMKAMIASFLDVFPDAELYLNREQATLLAGGGKRSKADTLARLRAGWTGEVAADMRRALLESPEALLASRVAGPEELRRFVGDVRRIRDDDPWIELTLPQYTHASPLAANIEALIALRPEDEKDDVTRAFDAVQRSYLLTLSGRDDLAVALLRSTLVAGRSPLLEHSVALRDACARLARDLAKTGRRAEAAGLARAELRDEDATVESLTTLRDAFLELSDTESLEALADRLARQWPDRPEGDLFRGVDLVEDARFAEAVPPLQRAAAIEKCPGYRPYSLSYLGRALLMTGQIEAGREALRRSLLQLPNQPEIAKLLRASPEVLAEVRRSFEARPAPRPSPGP